MLKTPSQNFYGFQLKVGGNEMNYITVDTGKESYPIYFEESFDSLSSAAEKCGYKGKKLCIISDSNVAPLYAER